MDAWDEKDQSLFYDKTFPHRWGGGGLLPRSTTNPASLNPMQPETLNPRPLKPLFNLKP